MRLCPNTETAVLIVLMFGAPAFDHEGTEPGGAVAGGIE